MSDIEKKSGGKQSHGGHDHAGSAPERIGLTAACAVSLCLGWLLDCCPILQGLFYTVSYVSGAWFAAAQAFQELRHRHITVDVLMLVAAFGAFLVGEVPEGAFLLFLFSLSGTLEQLILGRTRSAIQELVRLNPTEAIVRRDGAEVRLNVKDVVIGDRVIIRPGERVPVDGVVCIGTSSLDQSPITGESMPVDKAKGDMVLAGTLNLQGSIEIECRRRGEETTLARLVHLVEEAQTRKADSETISRWFGARYTVAVLVLGLASFLLFLCFGLGFGESFYRAMTVLVVASPCAIVISVPAAILSAIANAARNGVLIKGGAYLERLANLDVLAFDKTGTFTIGRPSVVKIVPANGVSVHDVLEAAAGAEALSEHPIARAILREWEAVQQPLAPAESLQAVPGKGVVATRGSERLILGKEELFTDEKIAIPPEVKLAVSTAQNRGWTTMTVGKNDRVLGSIAVADTLRPRASETLFSLRKLGMKRFIMLTGDNAKVAAEVARQLGSEYAADLLPEQKLRQLESLRASGLKIGMIGDGVNDAPSLAAADVGLSLGSAGTGVALEAADVVLMGDDLAKLPFVVDLAQRARRIVLQNLVFAAGVMVVLLTLSFVHGIRMPYAVVGHEGSTVLVILNGLRLLWYRNGHKPEVLHP